MEDEVRYEIWRGHLKLLETKSESVAMDYAAKAAFNYELKIVIAVTIRKEITLCDLVKAAEESTNHAKV